jgi:hypothetical protein
MRPLYQDCHSSNLVRYPKSPPTHLRLLFITNDADMAIFACANAVDRIFVDLEIIGKQERQGHLNTVISRHSVSDVARLRPVVPRGSLLVRLNPLHTQTDEEVEKVIEMGADILMLPMFKTPDDVYKFCNIVAGRAKVCLLVETIGAMLSLSESVRIRGVDEVHIGLNDLHLEMGCRFMFQPLADGYVDRMAQSIRDANLPFGIGGVARVGEGLLPAELLLSEHARLGSTGAILSRTFHRQARSVHEIEAQMDFAGEIHKLRLAYQRHCVATSEDLDSSRKAVKVIVDSIAAGL